MKTKDVSPTKFFWLDLEMTGLDPVQDLILEVAVDITDADFKTLESYEACIKYDRAAVAERMQKNNWWAEFPDNRDQFLNGLDKGKLLAEVEKELVVLVEKHFKDEPVILSGNSIHNDRLFIRQQMPSLDLKLHYRMLDVTAWKVIMQAKYGVVYEKKEVHRAFDDVQASIAELQHYLDWFQDNK